MSLSLSVGLLACVAAVFFAALAAAGISLVPHEIALSLACGFASTRLP